jgi:hypothetical protein
MKKSQIGYLIIASAIVWGACNNRMRLKIERYTIL